MVVYDDMAENKLLLYDKGIDSLPRDGNPLPFDHPGAGRLVYRSGEVHSPPLSSAEPLREEAADFLAAIAEARPPRSGSASGRGVVAALQAASLSLRENSRRVALNEI
jgi:predicted dehydrogenase